MADRKVTDDTALTGANIAVGDLLSIVDVSDTTDAASGTNKSMTVAEHILGFRRLGFVGQVATGFAASAFSNTASETTILTAAPTIANIAQGDGLRVRGGYTYLNNSGAGRTLQTRIKFGSTTAFTYTSSSLAASATVRLVLFDVTFKYIETFFVWHVYGRISIGPSSASSGNVTALNPAETAELAGALSFDPSSPFTLDVTAQMQTNNSTQTVTSRDCFIERIPA